MPFDFCGERDVVLLFYGPVHCRRVKLSVVEQEVLSPIVGSVGDFLGSSVKRS